MPRPTKPKLPADTTMAEDLMHLKLLTLVAENAVKCAEDDQRHLRRSIAAFQRKWLKP